MAKLAWIAAMMGGWAIALAGCTKTLDVAPIEAAIKADLSGKGRLSIQSVTCPTSIQPQAGQTFECTGALKPDGGFFITVKQEAEPGLVSWEVDHSWRLLNLSKLEAEMQQTPRQQDKKDIKVNCGGLYRATQPGDSFECRLAQHKPDPIPATVMVKVEPQGTVTWQQLRDVIAVKPTAALSATDSRAGQTPAPNPASLNPSAADGAGAGAGDSTAEAALGVKDASGWVQLDD